MFIEGSLISNKTEMLADKYAQLLNSGVKASEILVIAQNSTLKNNFQNDVLKKIKVDCIEKPLIHSFYSLVYNTVNDNWAFLEDRNIFDNPVILPNLSGLEVSQFILKDILKEVPFKGYNSRMSLIQQIFRRYSLIIQNNLSQTEIDERAKILKEGFSEEASLAIKKLLKKTLELRGFDYLRQCLLFNFIYKNTGYFNNIKYLFIDDADECTPIFIDFVEYLSKQLVDFYIAIDPLGSSRCGYLSADKNNYERLKRIFSNDLPPIACGDFPLKGGRNVCDNLCPLQGGNALQGQRGCVADKLFANVKDGKFNQLENFSYISFSKRSQMADSAIKRINELLKSGVKPCEISVISPVIDDMLKFTLKENLKNSNLLFITGSEKLIQNRFVNAVITILKLNTELKNSLSEFDIRVILSEFLKIQTLLYLKSCKS